MPDEIGFRPLTLEDRALFCGWLEHPHLDGWWGESSAEWALLEGDLASPRTARTVMRIVTLDGVPFAYVQDYGVRSYWAPQFDDLPQEARAMDTFLGEPAFLGRGLGHRYLALRADQLLSAGAPCVAVDPDPANARAIAAYGRAGFAAHRTAPCEDGDPVAVMVRWA
ncbi:MAG: GNAT family N-acetyltransferase [Paracoccaceae bacterium]